MSQFIDRTGLRFGRLIVLRRLGTSTNGQAIWLCACDCGAQKQVRSGALQSGTTSSCGCLMRETAARQGRLMRKHGQSNSPTYRSWHAMGVRCRVTPHNIKKKSFKYYAGAGVRVTARWRKYENFLADMGPRPPGTSLDRINGRKGYFKANCRWATISVQNNNASHVRRFRHRDGRSLTLGQWAEISGISRNLLYSRIVTRGWSLERAIATPIQLKTRLVRRLPEKP